MLKRNPSVPTIRERNGRWQVQVRLKGFPQHTEAMPEATTKKQAREWGLDYERQLTLAHLPSEQRKLLEAYTLKGLIVDYLRECQLAEARPLLKGFFGEKKPSIGYVYGKPLKRSHQNEREMLERFIRDEPVLSNKTLAHITTQDFEAYRDKRLKTIKPSTLRRELNPLRTIFRIAKKNRHIPLTSPFDSLELPKEDNERERLLSRDERDRLFKATLKCRGERQGYLWRALVVAALSTAMRRGELLKAKWGDVDFEKLTWNIPASNNKSSRSRLLPISKILRDNLQSYYNLLPEQDRKAEYPVFQSRKKDKQGNSVILPLSPSAHEQAFRRLCKRAKPPIANLTFHDLKHTALTSFAEKPIELGTRESDYMGAHKSERMGNRYEHLQMVESIRAKLDVEYPEDRKMEVPEVALYEERTWWGEELEQGSKLDVIWLGTLHDVYLSVVKGVDIKTLGQLSYSNDAKGISAGSDIGKYQSMIERALRNGKDMTKETVALSIYDLSEFRLGLRGTRQLNK
jgi:integrase